MTFDLYFHSRGPDQLQARDLEHYFGGSEHFSVQREADLIDFHYNNEQTGVYCTFSFQMGGDEDKSLEFRLNYNRPISFPYEAFPLVEDLCRQFNLMVEDAQENTVEPAHAGRLADSWRAHNIRVVQALVARGMALRYLSESKTFQWWRYTRVKQQIELSLTQQLFVPAVVLVESPEKRLFRMIVLAEGEAQLLPPSDYVWVERNLPGYETTGETETGFVSYDELIDRLRSHLDSYEAFGETVKYLGAAAAFSVIPIIRNLNLHPVDLSTHKQIAPDSFHNVELNQDISRS
jgi:hypothetical protein